MATTIDCGKVNSASGCGHVIRGETDEDALRLAGEHAVKDHGLQPTPELIAKVKENMHRE